MKKYFVKTNAGCGVVFVDTQGKAYMADEIAWDEPLNLEVAKNSDYSNTDGCETAEEICYSIGAFTPEEAVFVWNPDEYEEIIEF